MKVLLLHPQPAGPNRISTPIGMGCVGALLKREGHEATIHKSAILTASASALVSESSGCYPFCFQSSGHFLSRST